MKGKIAVLKFLESYIWTVAFYIKIFVHQSWESTKCKMSSSVCKGSNRCGRGGFSRQRCCKSTTNKSYWWANHLDKEVKYASCAANCWINVLRKSFWNLFILKTTGQWRLKNWNAINAKPSDSFQSSILQ